MVDGINAQRSARKLTKTFKKMNAEVDEFDLTAFMKHFGLGEKLMRGSSKEGAFKLVVAGPKLTLAYNSDSERQTFNLGESRNGSFSFFNTIKSSSDGREVEFKLFEQAALLKIMSVISSGEPDGKKALDKVLAPIAGGSADKKSDDPKVKDLHKA